MCSVLVTCVCIQFHFSSVRYMHYQTRPYVLSVVGGEEGRPRSTTNTSRPVNDMRCMPVYEELDGAADTLPRQQVLYVCACVLYVVHIHACIYIHV